MRAETLMVLLNFSPKNIKKTHPFWEKLLKTGVNLEQKNIKLKEWERKFKYFKSNWRFHEKIIIDFYSYLRLNFPNAIPLSLFFPCILEGNTDYNEYREEEFYDFEEKDENYSCDEGQVELQFDESIHYFKNDAGDDYYYHDDYDENQEEIQMIIDLADKWLSDILSGESFYKNNKDYFTKTEIKHFLTCDWVEPHIGLVSQVTHMDLLRHYWKAKIRANGLELSPEFFVNRFYFDFADRNVQEFFCFICNNKRYVRDENEISDIWDFLRIREHHDLNNITWQQLRRLNEDWHRRINNLPFFYGTAGKKKIWKKTIIRDFTHTVEEKIWTITEITTGKLLYEEGNVMHNCVSSYIGECIKGHCAIFSVKVNDKRVATLEIRRYNSEYILVQARGKMNMPVDKEKKPIIMLWAKENNIKLFDIIF